MLEVTDLFVARGSIAVLDAVSFVVAPGTVLILRGPNGAGKTTLLRALAGLQPPVAGTVAADPDDVVYAGHADGVKPTLTVAENLQFWAQVFGRSDIAPALSAFALEPLAGRMAMHLSAGQKRRLGLARLVVTGRGLWLLDEPTVSLDSSSVAMFADMIRGHTAAGGAAVIATHVETGLDAAILDITQFQATARPDAAGFDEAFL